MSYAAGNAASLLGQQLMQMAMRNRDRRREDGLRAEERDWRTQQATQAQNNWQRTFDANEAARGQARQDEGIVGGGLSIVPATGLDTSLPQAQPEPSGGVGAALQRLATAGVPSIKPPSSFSAPMVRQDAGYNPERDVDLQRRTALSSAATEQGNAAGAAERQRREQVGRQSGLSGRDLIAFVESGNIPAQREPTPSFQFLPGADGNYAVGDIRTGSLKPTNVGVGARPGQEREANWQVQQTDQGLVQVNPQTGEVRPVTMNGQPLQRPQASNPLAELIAQRAAQQGQQPERSGGFNLSRFLPGGKQDAQAAQPQGASWQSRAAELRQSGKSEDDIIATLRAEGLIR